MLSLHPCARDDSQLISLWVRHPLSRLPPCHLSPWILLKWQGICSSRSDRHFVAHYGVPDWSAGKTWIRFYKVQVWARTTRGPSPSRSEDQRWAQKASFATHAPPPEREAQVRERQALSFLSNSPVSTVNSYLTEVRWKFPAKPGQKEKGEFPLILRNEFSALQSSLSVELAVLLSPRGSPMSMPLPSEHWRMSPPLPRAHCR